VGDRMLASWRSRRAVGVSVGWAMTYGRSLTIEVFLKGDRTLAGDDWAIALQGMLLAEIPLIAGADDPATACYNIWRASLTKIDFLPQAVVAGPPILG
jgi:hypothetical protein